MQSAKSSLHWAWLTLILIVMVFANGVPAAASTERVLYRFQGGNDGAYPSSALIVDSAGNLYGTTAYGGGGACQFFSQPGCGIVFELSPPAQKRGPWTETVLYRFQGGVDGGYPGNTLILDQAGNLYGTTTRGGTGNCANVGLVGCGTVFELAPPSVQGGAWTESVLYNFQSTSDGDEPYNLIPDAAGNFYGVTVYGGPLTSSCQVGCGTVFELTPQQGGMWTKTTLYKFTGVPGNAGNGDGDEPIGLVFDNQGNLFGTTLFGGFCQSYEGGSCFGAVFELSPQNGGWTESVAYRFPAGFQNPAAGVVVDSSGTLYGTTDADAYELSVTKGEITLHTFGSNGDGTYPYGGVLLNASGNLLGTALGGGTSNNGIVFQLTRPKEGNSWKETILHNFAGGSDGSAPDTPVTLGGSGALYGSTLRGGNQKCDLGGGVVGCGTIFEIVP